MYIYFAFKNKSNNFLSIDNAKEDRVPGLQYGCGCIKLAAVFYRLTKVFHDRTTLTFKLDVRRAYSSCGERKQATDNFNESRSSLKIWSCIWMGKYIFTPIIFQYKVLQNSNILLCKSFHRILLIIQFHFEQMCSCCVPLSQPTRAHCYRLDDVNICLLQNVVQPPKLLFFLATSLLFPRPVATFVCNDKNKWIYIVFSWIRIGLWLLLSVFRSSI